MNTDLTGKRALVCGASKGIGRATAYALSGLGASVTLLARSADLLTGIANDLDRRRKHPDQDHDFVVVDFTDGDCLDLRKRIRPLLSDRTFHILVNNTGGPAAGPILEASPAEFARAFHNHILCSHTLTQLLVPGMKEAGFGRIINIISTSVKTPIPGLGVSNTTRGAMANWAKTVSNELAPFGITVNNVLPGSTDTERLRSLMAGQAERQGKTEEEVVAEWVKAIPMGRFGLPEEIADAVAFLASPAASYITGTNLTVDGGRTPAW